MFIISTSRHKNRNKRNEQKKCFDDFRDLFVLNRRVKYTSDSLFCRDRRTFIGADGDRIVYTRHAVSDPMSRP